jgi:hypothetical protein
MENSLTNIVNGDETMWLVCVVPRKTIRRKGEESVRINVDGYPKAGLTIMCTVNAKCEKLPLFIIAQGTTERCHNQLGIHPGFNYHVEHSKTGWMVQELVFSYFRFLRRQIPNGIIYLVFDQYPTHISQPAKALAERLNIQIIPIPKGATSQYQQLDRSVFGVMKNYAREKWDDLASRRLLPKQDKVFATALALEAWEKINQETIERGWDFDIDIRGKYPDLPDESSCVSIYSDPGSNL